MFASEDFVSKNTHLFEIIMSEQTTVINDNSLK